MRKRLLVEEGQIISHLSERFPECQHIEDNEDCKKDRGVKKGGRGSKKR